MRRIVAWDAKSVTFGNVIFAVFSGHRGEKKEGKKRKYPKVFHCAKKSSLLEGTGRPARHRELRADGSRCGGGRSGCRLSRQQHDLGVTTLAMIIARVLVTMTMNGADQIVMSVGVRTARWRRTGLGRTAVLGMIVAEQIVLTMKLAAVHGAAALLADNDGAFTTLGGAMRNAAMRHGSTEGG